MIRVEFRDYGWMADVSLGLLGRRLVCTCELLERNRIPVKDEAKAAMRLRLAFRQPLYITKRGGK